MTTIETPKHCFFCVLCFPLPCESEVRREAHKEHGKCVKWGNPASFQSDMLALLSLFGKDKKVRLSSSIGVKPLPRRSTLALSLCVVCIILSSLPSTRRAPCRVVLRSKPRAQVA